MNPSVDALNGEFEMSTDSQKEENLNFQNQLTELKKEKSIIGQMITASHKRTEFLLGQVGKYWSVIRIVIATDSPNIIKVELNIYLYKVESEVN